MLALDDLPLATFEDKENFPHFSNPEQSGCFACNSRLMVVRPIQVTQDRLLMPATTRAADGSFRVIPWAWQVYPRKHITSFRLMPRDWTAQLQYAASQLGLADDFNPTANVGKKAGQSADHRHDWLVDRGMLDEEGLLTEGLGLVTILLRVQQYGIGLR